jgi:outer membrane protein OmpA-like peptidoglycan-associated protein
VRTSLGAFLSLLAVLSCNRHDASSVDTPAAAAGTAAPANAATPPAVAASSPLAICRHPQDQLPPTPYTGSQWAAPTVTGDTVPLRAGLIVVTAVAMPNGDFESLKSIEKLSDDGLELSYHADVPVYDTATHQYRPKPMYSARFVFNDDEADACAFAPDFHDQVVQPPPDTFVGATTITFSARMLTALKTGQNEYVQLLTHTTGFADDADGRWLHLASTQPVPVSLLLDNQPVTLSALRAVCNADSLHVNDDHGDATVVIDTPCEYLILDDPSGPLVLLRRSLAVSHRNDAWHVDTELTAVVRLAYIGSPAAGPGGPGGPPPPGGGKGAHGGRTGNGGNTDNGGNSSMAAQEQQMESSLAAGKKVLVYGIYFDFAKATIKKESDPVLHEIADLMHKNPTWTLAINGYTDSIGGDAYNLDLSKRRAAAVKDTLVTGYHLAAARLTTAGYGAASPVDSNATLEGRARNRRVELIRQ